VVVDAAWEAARPAEAIGKRGARWRPDQPLRFAVPPKPNAHGHSRLKRGPSNPAVPILANAASKPSRKMPAPDQQLTAFSTKSQRRQTDSLTRGKCGQSTSQPAQTPVGFSGTPAGSSHLGRNFRGEYRRRGATVFQWWIYDFAKSFKPGGAANVAGI